MASRKSPKQKLDVDEMMSWVAAIFCRHGDDNLERHYYAVKAFPMPNACVGVVFENISLRKKMDEMLKSYAQQAREKGP